MFRVQEKLNAKELSWEETKVTRNEWPKDADIAGIGVYYTIHAQEGMGAPYRITIFANGSGNVFGFECPKTVSYLDILKELVREIEHDITGN